MLDDVFQLADVAGKIVGHEPRQDLGFEPNHRAAAQPVHAADEPFHEQGDVLAPRAQGRQFQPDHVDPVEQVAAEGALGHQGLQIPVGGREDAQVDPLTGGGAERLELALLEYAQQFHLEGRAGFADLVEQDGAALGQGEVAGLVPLGAGEGAGLVAEQLGFEQGVGQGAAVDGHERPVTARAEVVQGAGEQLLAGAGLALDEHGGVAFGDLRQDGEQPTHQVTGTDHVALALVAAQFAAQLVDHGVVAEGLHPAEDLARLVAQGRGGHADGDALALGVDDVGGGADVGAPLLHGAAQGAVALAHVGAEHLPAVAADGLDAGHAGDLLGGAVERGDAPLVVHGEHPVGDGFENDVGDLGRRPDLFLLRHAPPW